MEIERTVRAAFALQAPAPDFEDVVMARVSAAAWRASQVAPRARLRILALGAVVVAAAAAAVLVKRHGDSGSAPAMPPPVAEVSAPLSLDVAVPVSAVVPPVTTAVAAVVPAVAPLPPTQADVSQLCTAAQAGPAVAPAYTVLMEPLKFQTDDPELASRAQKFYAAAINQLKSVPGLGLVGSEAAMTGAKPADYRVILVIEKKPDSKAGQLAWQSTATLQRWTGKTFGNGLSVGSAAPAMDAGLCSSTPAVQDFNCRLDQAGARSVTTLSANLPRHPTSAQAACESAQQRLFREQIAQQSRDDPARFFAIVRQMLDRLAANTDPTLRANAWGSVGRTVRPEFAQPLVLALRESTDEAFRREAVTLLAMKFPDDPGAREALAAVVATSPDALVRHVARLPVSGEGALRDYAISRLSDDRLPTEQRLQPLFWMAEAMSLDNDRISAEISALLAALQRGNGIGEMAKLLAGTQVDPRGEYGVIGKQGQSILRQIGSVNHPAAPELLIASFDTTPNYLTLSILAARRDDPRVASKLESIAGQSTDEQLRRDATRYLNQPLTSRPPARAGR